MGCLRGQIKGSSIIHMAKERVEIKVKCLQPGFNIAISNILKGSLHDHMCGLHLMTETTQSLAASLHRPGFQTLFWITLFQVSWVSL